MRAGTIFERDFEAVVDGLHWRSDQSLPTFTQGTTKGSKRCKMGKLLGKRLVKAANRNVNVVSGLRKVN